MAGQLDGKNIAILATDGVEQVELTEPRKALEEAGARTELVSLKPGEILGFNHLDHGDRLPVDKTVKDASPGDYDAVLVPVQRRDPRSAAVVPRQRAGVDHS